MAAACVEQSITANLEHGVVDVGQHNLTGFADQAGKFDGQITSATGQVQHLVARANAGQFDGHALENAMTAHGNQVVHHIVFARYRAEYAGHLLLFFLPRYLLVAEVCDLVVVGHINSRKAWGGRHRPFA